MVQLNPMERDGAEAVERVGNNEYRVTMNGNVYTVHGNSCDCGHERNYTPSQSAGFEQSYRKRRQASCKHQVAVLNAKELGQCECGAYQVRENEMSHQGRHVMSEYVCTSCGNTIAKE